MLCVVKYDWFHRDLLSLPWRKVWTRFRVLSGYVLLYLILVCYCDVVVLCRSGIGDRCVSWTPNLVPWWPVTLTASLSSTLRYTTWLCMSLSLSVCLCVSLHVCVSGCLYCNSHSGQLSLTIPPEIGRNSDAVSSTARDKNSGSVTIYRTVYAVLFFMYLWLFYLCYVYKPSPTED